MTADVALPAPAAGACSPNDARAASPLPPSARGPLSAAVLSVLTATDDAALTAARAGLAAATESCAAADPYGEDLQLALYACYELHYRGFAGVADDLEWDPDLIALRRAAERRFEAALRRDVGGGDDVAAAVASLLVEDPRAQGVSHHLRRDGQAWQLREYVALRSLYHLKEADPQAWVIPRLEGQAKASLVTVEHDEYGAGRGERMHARLFAEMMTELGLDAGYGAYLDVAPAEVLAEVNLMSMCGLRRSLRGALVGQFAVVELTSSPGSQRLVRAAARLGSGEATTRFYAEHVEADAVHEQVVRRGVLDPMLAAEPGLAADVVLGIQASVLLDERLSGLLLGWWAQGRSALRRPLPDTPA